MDKVDLCEQDCRLLLQLLRELITLVFRLEDQVVSDGLFEDAEELNRLQSKLIGGLHLLLVNLDQHLLVAALGDIPGETGLEQDVGLVHICKELFIIARLVFAGLVPQDQA